MILLVILAMLAVPLLAQLYADVRVWLTIRDRWSPCLGFGLIASGVLATLIGLACLGWMLVG